jgi:hypothetical protein
MSNETTLSEKDREYIHTVLYHLVEYFEENLVDHDSDGTVILGNTEGDFLTDLWICVGKLERAKQS